MNFSALAAARAIAPLVRSRVDDIDAARELPADVFAALADKRLFQLALPRSVGGLEIDLPQYVEVLEVLGSADASTAWVVNQVVMFSTYARCMAPAVAREIWTETPASIVANSPAKNATAVAVPGGYRVSGRQGFSTGCRHASWIAAHGVVVENGVPRLRGDAPDVRYFFARAAEVQIIDTWRVCGMRGTGTHDFVMEDVFVPEPRTVPSITPPAVDAPRNEVGPLYRIPRTLLFASGDAAIALGVARACISEFLKLAIDKVPRGMKSPLREQAIVQRAVGHAEAALRSGRALVFETVRELWPVLGEEGRLTADLQAGLRLATTHAIRLAIEAVDTIYDASGASAIYTGNPIHRYFQDIHVISQHLQGRLSHYETVGRHWLGLPLELGAS